MIFLFANQMNLFWEKEIREIAIEFPNHQFIVSQTPLERESVIQKADGIIIGNMPLDTLTNAYNLKILFVPWTGLDRLPFNLLRKLNCMIANTHGNANAVAERALGLCLSLLGRITEFDCDLRKGKWHGYSVNSPENDKWISLHKKSVGIIGYGIIGQHLAELLNPFHCMIYALKKHPPRNGRSRDIIFSNSLEDIIEKSEILFLLLPLTQETKNIINKEILLKMKDKFLINLGRGKLIEENALYESLKNNELKGFASDVWYQYPKEKSSTIFPSLLPFHLLSNVVLSPHVGGFNRDGQKDMILQTFDNIRNFIQKGKPLYLASLQNEY